MTDHVDAARESIGRAIFQTWKAHDIDGLVRLTRKFSDAVKDDLPAGRRGRVVAGGPVTNKRRL
jgi:hypothetical protein